MKTFVYVVTADAITDVKGELMQSGYVVGVYSTEEKADEAIDKDCAASSIRRRWDYNIDEMEIQ